MQGHNRDWCRRLAGFAIAAALALSGCDEGEPGSGGAPDAGPAAREPNATTPTPAAPLWSSRYYDGYLAEVLRGDVGTARAAYREVMVDADNADAVLAARAALHLAELEAWAGRRREAVELVARAMALGGRDPDIVERADQLQVWLASVRSERAGVRGPPVGTEPADVSADAKARFREAEELLEAYYGIDVQPRIEDLQAGVRARQRAVEAAVRAYREVIELGEPAATAAAELRIASLYHDLAIALVFDLPPELERRAAARLRRQFRARAVQFLRKASEAYRLSLAAAPEDAAGERWRRAAEQGLGAVQDLLRGGD